MERDSERQELVFGVGVLAWQQPGGLINHPVLLQRLRLAFDPQKPEFVLSETEHSVELYSTLFQAIQGIDGSLIAKLRQELENSQPDLLNGEAVSHLLRRFVVQLSSRGEFVDEIPSAGTTENPKIAYAPVLFLRSRTFGFSSALESILADLRDRSDLPHSLLNVVGIEPLARNSMDPAASINFAAANDEILLSKPANQEQIEVAQRLDAYGCVLVQGPPGTGKTHTIANLIGHLLAQGKSILVTSHSSKALRVLHKQVVPQLQPLCVSVLEGTGENRQQLKQSVSAIVERLASSSADTLAGQGEAAALRRRALRSSLQQQRKQLQEARFDEYRDVVVAGQAYSPSEAARRVADGKNKHSWIPTPVSIGSPLPLPTEDLIALYRTNVSVSKEDEQDFSNVLPETKDLLTPSQFAQLISDRQRLEENDLYLAQELWQPSLGASSPEAIETLLNKLTQAVMLMNSGTEWQSAAIEAGRQGGPQKQVWTSLLVEIEAVVREAAAAQETLMRHGPVLADHESLEAQSKVLTEIIKHLESGKSLSWAVLLIHSDWKKLLSAWSVGGKTPQELEELTSLKTLADLRQHRHQLMQRWQRQMTPLGGSAPAELGAAPEVACRQYQPLIQNALDWYQKTWLPLEQEFQQVGFHWSGLLQNTPLNLAAHGDLLRVRDTVLQALPSVFYSRANYLRVAKIQQTINAAIHNLENLEGTNAVSLITALKEALQHSDSAKYQKYYARFTELKQKSVDFSNRREWLRRLENAAPAWAASIRDRRPHHDGYELPREAEAAWLWCQLNEELNRRQQVSLNTLQQSITETDVQLQQVTAELVNRRAWAAQIRRTNLDQRKALVGWLKIMDRIGQGTGKMVPKFQAEARQLMAEARTAVPVWIMPLTRVVESFDPANTRFDVIIVDEASQSDAMSLIALYMGAQVVVVGDDEQVSPDAVGENLEETHNLIAQHLAGVPNALLFDGKQSLYDLALSSFGGTVCLREHFRCVSDIIQFSNRLSYDGKIKPLRDASAVATKPYVVNYRVEGATSANKVNEEEAWATASLLVAATEQPEYAGNTMGVISLVGEEQALRIATLLRQYLSPVEYENRRIMCGTPSQFQGDERDIMFLSMVDGPQNGPLPIKQEPRYRKRFNVAASRARNQMWVIHSLSLEKDLKSGDLRRLLIEHAQDPQAFERVLQEKEKETDSEFERQVLRRLMALGYQVQPQWKVGSYRIDIVVEGTSKKLAVECDGDRFHTLDNLADDMQRQAILERLEWTFVRIRGSEFFRDPDSAMQPLLKRLQEMDIVPFASSLAEHGTEGQEIVSEELLARVIRRADDLRRTWRTRPQLMLNASEGALGSF